jgi:hypothetical protein
MQLRSRFVLVQLHRKSVFLRPQVANETSFEWSSLCRWNEQFLLLKLQYPKKISPAAGCPPGGRLRRAALRAGACGGLTHLSSSRAPSLFCVSTSHFSSTQSRAASNTVVTVLHRGPCLQQCPTFRRKTFTWSLQLHVEENSRLQQRRVQLLLVQLH